MGVGLGCLLLLLLLLLMLLLLLLSGMRIERRRRLLLLLRWLRLGWAGREIGHVEGGVVVHAARGRDDGDVAVRGAEIGGHLTRLLVSLAHLSDVADALRGRLLQGSCIAVVGWIEGWVLGGHLGTVAMLCCPGDELLADAGG